MVDKIAAYNPISATAAYERNATKVAPGFEAALEQAGNAASGFPSQDQYTNKTSGDGFLGLVQSTADKAIESGINAEQVTAKALAGEADIVEVVTSVKNAEAQLKTIVSIRDRLVSAYQEILRMPV